PPHDLGVPVAAHCRSASSTRDAAKAGVDIILHASYMDDEALEAVIESGSALCPTFTFLANLADYGDRIGAGVGMADVFRGEIKATADKMRQAYDEGVTIMCGSESGFALTPYGEWHAREMEVLVDALGLSNLEAITCATKNNDRALRMEGRVGVIQSGCVADIIVVDGDPSKDVRILQDKTNIKAVVSRGQNIDITSELPRRSRIQGEKVSSWAGEVLTYDIAMGR
ncbi:MAG: amidohydrolase family protein, partial [Ilumatobacteraceae bacterium]